MNGFIITTAGNPPIRFRYYMDDAPLTCEAFDMVLPFQRTFYHARVSGEEIWIDNAPPVDIVQENSSVFTQPGEIIIAPVKPTRNKIAKCMGIFYGEGKLVDGGNIFAKAFEEDLPILKKLGDDAWRKGAQLLAFERYDP